MAGTEYLRLKRGSYLVEARVYTYENRRKMGQPDYVNIGRGTYWVDGTRWHRFSDDETIDIGQFCSISIDVQFVCGGCHKTSLVSTFPFIPRQTYDWDRRRNILVENDVWFGEGVYVGGGSIIHNGAVLGANAVIFGEVPPYAVMLGNPAKVYRYRFSKRTIKDLLKIAWWNWPSERLKSLEDWFYKPIEVFIEEFK